MHRLLHKLIFLLPQQLPLQFVKLLRRLRHRLRLRLLTHHLFIIFSFIIYDDTCVIAQNMHVHVEKCKCIDCFKRDSDFMATLLSHSYCIKYNEFFLFLIVFRFVVLLFMHLSILKRNDSLVYSGQLE